MNKKIIIVIAAVLLLAVAALIIARKGWYPVALVNWQPVFRFDLNENVRAALQFYQARGVAQPGLAVKWTGDEGEKNLQELKKNVMAAMIEDRIVRRVFRNEGFRDLEGEALKKVDEALGDRERGDDFVKGVRLLYGWDVSALRKRLLEPGARREALEEKMAAEGVNFDEWFLEQKQKANVKVFLVGTWDKETGTVE